MFAFSGTYTLLFVARTLQGIGSSFSSVAGNADILNTHTFLTISYYSYLQTLYNLYEEIKTNGKTRNGKKSFHILMMHYFEDMYWVFKEMKRVLREGSKAYLILGDSAPYGVYIPTTQYLG